MNEILEAFQTALDEAEPGLQKHMREAGASCREGCSFCCYQLTPIHWVEAKNMARAVKELGRDVLVRVKKDCLEQVKLLARGDVDPHGRWRKLLKACPLLEDGRCLVYGARPLACRGHAVVSDPALCDLRVVANVKIIPGTVKTMLGPASMLYGENRIFPPFEAPLPLLLHYALMEPREFRLAKGYEVLSRATKKWRKHGANENPELTRALAGEWEV